MIKIVWLFFFFNKVFVVIVVFILIIFIFFKGIGWFWEIFNIFLIFWIGVLG